MLNIDVVSLSKNNELLWWQRQSVFINIANNLICHLDYEILSEEVTKFILWSKHII